MRTLRTNVKSQRGITALGAVAGLFIAGFILTCGFKIVPVYYENSLVRDVLIGLGESPAVLEMEKDDVRRKLTSSFDLNGVRGTPTKSIKIIRRGDGLLVNIDYEERIPFWGNLDVVVRFENQLDTTKPGDCCIKIIPDVAED